MPIVEDPVRCPDCGTQFYRRVIVVEVDPDFIITPTEVVWCPSCHRELKPDEGNAVSFTCPRCSMVSYNLNDIREGYCGHCHDWTDP